MKNKNQKLNTHSRAIKLCIVDKEAIRTIEEELKPKHESIFTIFSSYIFQHGRSWTWIKPPYLTRTNNDNYARTVICNTFKKELIDIGITKYVRNFAMIVLSNYSSYINRPRKNKKKIDRWPCSPIKLKTNKGLRYDDGGCKIKNGKLYLPGLSVGLPFIFTRKTVKDSTEKYLNNKIVGGTLIKRNNIWVFTCRYSKQQKNKYEPTEWIGTDFNQTNKDWMTLYIPSIGYTSISRNEKLQELEDNILEVNQKLKSKDTTGGKRRYFNNKRITLHKEHLKLVRPEIRGLCDLVKKIKAGIIIDAARPGQRTWGQDKIAKLLPTYCVNHGIPCYINNPAYTSITCPICKQVDKKNRVDTNTFLCVHCGYKNNAQHVGALNCHNFGIEKIG